MQREISSAINNEIAKATPPAAVIGAHLMNFSLQDWVYITAIIYAVLQILYLLWKWIREWRRKSSNDDSNEYGA